MIGGAPPRTGGMTAPAQRVPARIVAVLAGAAAVLAAAGLGWTAWSARQQIVPPNAVRVALLEVGPQMPRIAGGSAAEPLVVLDPGHGGHDPGAVGPAGNEADVVLALAERTAEALRAGGGVRVALTRADNRFLALEERVAIARRLGADLFVSLHADAAEAGAVAQGGSIYTLSTRASSREAALFAQRENNADIVNGIPARSGNAAVDTILFDLSQQRVQDDADAFSRLLVREGAGTLRFRSEPRRSAALVVLTAPDVPSVLVETGFITDTADAARLTDPEWQGRFAGMLARTIRHHLLAYSGPERAAQPAAQFMLR